MHKVTLESFAIDRTEVTQAAYFQCVGADACSAPACFWNPDEAPDSPVRCVTWFDAEDYCEWQGKRLPTEAEWEFAARGHSGGMWPWGVEPPTCSLAVMDEGGDGCGKLTPASVCSKSPQGDTQSGLCDMSGNAREWVNDWFAKDYYLVSPETAPQGPDSGEERSIRGGGYVDPSSGLRTVARYWAKPSDINGTLGFRCALTP